MTPGNERTENGFFFSSSISCSSSSGSKQRMVEVRCMLQDGAWE